ncbi:uncharacterized protein [Ptychodera flava]|uniref:uncharacterized protein isoform X1 n=2 Tax=Ptychodera flava TaxID=63121 RepID=UPI00396A7657
MLGLQHTKYSQVSTTSPDQVEMSDIETGDGHKSISASQSHLVNGDSGRDMTIMTPFAVMENWVRPIFAEFFGVMLFVFIGSLSGVVGYPDGDIDGASGLIAAALAHGLAIFLLIAGIGAVSGGHFNPAVTLGVMCSGGIHLILGCLYIVFQLVGAICGSALVLAVLTKEQFDFINGGATLLGAGIATDKAVGCEWVLTMVLVSTVLQTAVDSKPSNLAPLAIGMAVAADILAGGTISGASMNPARSFGPAVVSGIWTDQWVYWVGPPAGGICSALVFKLILASPDKRWVLKSD